MCRLPAPTKVFLQLKHNTDASSIKSISGVTLSGNAPSQGIFIKCRAVFYNEIKPCIIFAKEGSFDIRTQYSSRICPAGSNKFPYFKNIISPTLKKCK